MKSPNSISNALINARQLAEIQHLKKTKADQEMTATQAAVLETSWQEQQQTSSNNKVKSEIQATIKEITIFNNQLKIQRSQRLKTLFSADNSRHSLELSRMGLTFHMNRI